MRSEQAERAKNEDAPAADSFPESTEKMKKTTYVVGIASGLLLARYWKVIVKEGIKAGVMAGQQIKKVSDQVLEDMEDASAEAFDELQEKAEKAGR